MAPSKVKSSDWFENALNLDIRDTEKLYRKYLNSTIVDVIKIIGTNRKFVGAKGMSLKDQSGRHYLDFMAGFGVHNLGHEPIPVLEALRRAENLPNVLQASLNPFSAKLGELLANITPGDLSKTFFCSSGAEAVESALKISRKATGRKKFLYLEGAYHGKSYGALSVSSREKYKEPFEPLLEDALEIPFNDLEALEEHLADKDIACFIVEPIQGENGARMLEEGYLKAAEKLCTLYGTLLVVDEIQTGFGRTGKLFACEHENVQPDILCLSKALGGGVMPIGAMVATARVWNKAYGSFQSGLLHTTTFGNNTRASICGLAALHEILNKRLWENAERIGKQLFCGLQEIQKDTGLIQEIRGRGLMLGIVLKQVKGHHELTEGALTLWVARKLFKKHGFLTAFTLNNYDVLRIAPPLIVSERQTDDFLAALRDVLDSIEKFEFLQLFKAGQNG